MRGGGASKDLLAVEVRVERAHDPRADPERGSDGAEEDHGEGPDGRAEDGGGAYGGTRGTGCAFRGGGASRGAVVRGGVLPGFPFPGAASGFGFGFASARAASPSFGSFALNPRVGCGARWARARGAAPSPHRPGASPTTTGARAVSARVVAHATRAARVPDAPRSSRRDAQRADIAFDAE